MANIALCFLWAIVIAFGVFTIGLLICGLIVLIKIAKDFLQED